MSDLREYHAQARSTDTFGRVLCNAREQYFVMDGPVWNNCPGEALTPGEAFLASAAACGVELAQVIAAEESLDVGPIEVQVDAVVDRASPVRDDMTVFNQVRMRFAITGVSPEEAESLAAGVGRRCPIYGSIAASAGSLEVEVSVR